MNLSVTYPLIFIHIVMLFTFNKDVRLYETELLIKANDEYNDLNLNFFTIMLLGLSRRSL